MKRLLNTLRVCGLLMMGIGCQNTPPVTSESEKVDTVQKSETQQASMPEATQEAAPKPRAAAPASKQRRMASTTPAAVIV